MTIDMSTTMARRLAQAKAIVSFARLDGCEQVTLKRATPKWLPDALKPATQRARYAQA